MNVRISGAGYAIINGLYNERPWVNVPAGFARTCDQMKWPAAATWKKLSVPNTAWYKHESNDSYIYFHNDGTCWIDDPSGAGVYIAPYFGSEFSIPKTGWKPLGQGIPPFA